MGRGQGREQRGSSGDEAGLSSANAASLVYLTSEEVLSLYAELMGIPDVESADFVRDRNLLESALARPQNAVLYEGADVARQAATLAWGLARNHAFHDGNKRVAHLVAVTFLEANGYTLLATEDEQFDLMLAMADRGASLDAVAEWFRQHLA